MPRRKRHPRPEWRVTLQHKTGLEMDLHLQAKPGLGTHFGRILKRDKKKIIKEEIGAHMWICCQHRLSEWYWHLCQAIHVMASASGRIKKKRFTSSVLVYKKYYSNDQVSILTFSVCCHAAPTAAQLLLPMAFLVQYEWNICEMERATKISMHAKCWILAYPDFFLV